MLYPMFALVLVTYAIMLINFYWRVQAVKAKAVPIKYFKVYQGDEVPDHLISGKNHIANLFEMPVLFYAVGILCLVFHYDSAWIKLLAWLYVLLRIVHAYFHMGSNNVIYRMRAFWAHATVLLVMWVSLIGFVG